MGSVTHRRWGALGELMLSHLCPAVDPVLVQPHIPDPWLLHYLSWSDSHTAVYTAHPPAPALLRPLFTFRKQLQILKEQASLPFAPLSLSSSTPTQYPAVLALCGSFLTPSVCPYWSICPRVREQCTGHKKMGPAIPSCSSRGCPALCLPTALSGYPWPFRSPPTCPQAVNAGRHLSPVCFVLGPLHLLCLLTGCVPRQPQGSCVSPEKWKSLSCPTLCDLMDYTVNGILQARILEWVAFPFSKGSSQPRDHIQVSCIAGWFFSSWATGEAQQYWSGLSILSPAYLPDPGIELGSPALQADSLPIELSRTSPYIGLYVGLYD